MTRYRALVLENLDGLETPCSALFIAHEVRERCDQATVYRALHWLEAQGHVESFILHCREHGTERYYVHRKLSHRHWFHCTLCHRFLDLGSCTMESQIRHWEKSFGIIACSHELHVTGLCATCSSSTASK